MICKGCGEEKKLIKAHIIPKSFYMDLRGDENHLNVVPTDIEQREGRSNIGDYDTEILCKECDLFISRYDDYGKRLLLDQVASFKELRKDGKLYAYMISDYNYLYLKLFLLSILWRASISKRSFFKAIDIGEHENQIKDLIFRCADDGNTTYGCTLSKFMPADIGSLERTIINPDCTKIDEINYYRFWLGGYTSWIRVDTKQDPEGLGRLELMEGRDAILFTRSFQNSNEHKLIEKGVKTQNAKKI